MTAPDRAATALDAALRDVLRLPVEPFEVRLSALALLLMAAQQGETAVVALRLQWRRERLQARGCPDQQIEADLVATAERWTRRARQDS